MTDSVAKGAMTNKNKKSLIKVIVFESIGIWKTPESGEKFYIDEDAKFPEIIFEIVSQSTGEFKWSWTVEWNARIGTYEGRKRGSSKKVFKHFGKFSSTEKKWKADLNGACLGGKLTVEVRNGPERFKRIVRILGKNPGSNKIKEELQKTNLTPRQKEVMMKIFQQESYTRQFVESDGEPVVSFDGGYGLAQLTNPAPSYRQIWDWREHLQFSAKHYLYKESEAVKYLKKIVDAPSLQEIELETICRWNGGAYHKEKAKDGKLQRKDTVCDKQTSNIGWDPRKTENADKTEEELRERDKKTYGAPSAPHSWDYSGVCYAEHVLR